MPIFLVWLDRTQSKIPLLKFTAKTFQEQIVSVFQILLTAYFGINQCKNQVIECRSTLDTLF